MKYLPIAVMILLLATGLRWYTVAGTAVTTDEALTYQRTLGSLQDRLEHIAGPGNHVPLYFLSVELLPHETEIGLRYGSLLLSLVGIALFMRMVQWLYGDPVLSTTIGLWASVSPFMVYYGRDARPYAMIFVWSLLVSALFFKLVHKQQTGQANILYWIGFVVVSMAAYTTHYAAASLPITQFVILVWLRTRFDFMLRWLAAQAIASLPTFAWILSFAQPKGEPNDWIDIPNLGRPYYTITNITIGYKAIPTWYFVIGLIPLTTGLIMGIRYAWRSQNWINRYWLVLAFGPMVLIFLISQVRPLYFERYFMVVAPAFFILIALGWRQLNDRVPYLANVAIVVLVAAGVTVHELNTTHFEDQDWRNSAGYVAGHLTDGEGVLMDGPFKTAFWHYWRDEPSDVVLSREIVDVIYDQPDVVCDLGYERLWLLTGSSLNHGQEDLLSEFPAVWQRDYHNIRVWLLPLNRCE